MIPPQPGEQGTSTGTMRAGRSSARQRPSPQRSRKASSVLLFPLKACPAFEKNVLNICHYCQTELSISRIDEVLNLDFFVLRQIDTFRRLMLNILSNLFHISYKNVQMQCCFFLWKKVIHHFLTSKYNVFGRKYALQLDLP